MRSNWWVLSFCLVLLFPSLLVAQATRPATQPVLLASPRELVLAWAEAIESGDGAAMQRLTASDEPLFQLFAAARAEAVVQDARLRAAVSEHIPADAHTADDLYGVLDAYDDWSLEAAVPTPAQMRKSLTLLIAGKRQADLWRRRLAEADAAD